MTLPVELRSLRNVCTTPAGRTALAGAAVVLACLVGGGLALASTLSDPGLLEAVRTDPDVLAALVTLLASLPALLVLAFAKQPCARSLFASPHVPVLLTAPVGAGRLVVGAWLQRSASALAWTLPAIAAPAVAVVLGAGLPVRALVATLAIVALVVGAVTAATIVALVLVTRWLSGTRVRQAVTLLHVLFATAVILTLLSGVGRGDDIRVLLQRVGPEASVLGRLARTLGGLPVAAAHGAAATRAWLGPLLLMATTAALLALAAASYRRAFEAWLCGGKAAVVVRQLRGWPGRPVASLLHRARLESWRARGNLGLLALLCAMVVWRVASATPSAPPDDPAPQLRDVFFLLEPWQLLASALSMLLLLGVVGDDQKQIALLATSPLRRLDLVRARVVTVGWPFLLTVALTAVTASVVHGTAWAATSGFALTALPITLLLVGACVAVGSWPAFVAVHSHVPLASNLRTVVPVLVMAAVAGAALYGTWSARDLLLHHDSVVAPWLLLGVWIAGGGACWLGVRLARGNLERLLGPQ